MSTRRFISLVAAPLLLLAPSGWSSRSSPSGPVVYLVTPASRLQVATGKAGLFGFAGHAHLIRAQAFTGRVVYEPDAPAKSRVEILVSTDRLEVLTPPDTEEIRKVTTAMRTDVLAIERFRTISFISKRVAVTDSGFRLVGALTIAGQSVDVPVDVRVRAGPDTLHAWTRFAVNQTAFGIKPYRGGPGGTVRVADRVTFDIAIVAVRE